MRARLNHYFLKYPMLWKAKLLYMLVHSLLQLLNDIQGNPALAHLQFLQDWVLQEQVAVKSSREIELALSFHLTDNQHTDLVATNRSLPPPRWSQLCRLPALYVVKVHLQTVVTFSYHHLLMKKDLMTNLTDRALRHVFLEHFNKELSEDKQVILRYFRRWST